MTRLMSVLLVLCAGGCAANDPYRASDRWQPTGANAGNLAAMAATPRDLVAGRSRRSGSGRPEIDAVERLWDGRARPLASVTGPSAAGAANAGRGAN
ncbi:MAG: hypothetical protein NVSMB18_10110 [Acetobacteraceae bacterium]